MLPLADYFVEMSEGKVKYIGRPIAPASDPSEHVPGTDVSSINKVQNFIAATRVPQKAKKSDPTSGQMSASPAAFNGRIPQISKERTETGTPAINLPMTVASTNELALFSIAGAVGAHVYKFYFSAFGSRVIMLALVAVIALTEVAAVYTNWFLRLWTQSFNEVGARALTLLKPAFGISDGPHDLKCYVLLACLSLILYGGRLRESSTPKGHGCDLSITELIYIVFWFWRGTCASAKVYDKVIKSLLVAPGTLVLIVFRRWGLY